MPLFISACIASCSGTGGDFRKTTYEFLPADEVTDVPRTVEDFYALDANNDQLKNADDFTYESLLKTKISIKINLYDVRSVPANQLQYLKPAKTKTHHKSSAPISTTVMLQNSTGEVLFAAKTDSSGTASGIAVSTANLDVVTLALRQSGNLERDILVENFSEIKEMNRTMSLAQTAESEANCVMPDADGDLIPDVYDAYPLDPSKAFRITGAEHPFLTVGFNDNFPGLGDGDYNDFVARYNVTQILNSQNEIVRIEGIVEAVARAAGYDHRFGIVINFPGASGLLRILNSDSNGQNQQQRTSNVSDKADIIIWENTKQAFDKPAGAPSIDNGRLADPHSAGHFSVFSIEFANPVPSGSIDNLPYDPYIFVHNTGYDIHLMGNPPLEGSANPPGEEDFRDPAGFPWGLLVPIDWAWPLESTFIEVAYPQFQAWRESIGQTNSDWYFFPDENQVYPQPNLNFLFDQVIAQGNSGGEAYQLRMFFDRRINFLSTLDPRYIYNGTWSFDVSTQTITVQYQTVDEIDPECQQCGIIATHPAGGFFIPPIAQGAMIASFTENTMTLIPQSNPTPIVMGPRQGFGPYDEIQDSTPPSSTAAPSTGSFLYSIAVRLQCFDDLSGCRDIVYTDDGTDPSYFPLNGNLIIGSYVDLLLDQPRNYDIKMIGRDNFDNISDVETFSYTYDPDVIDPVIIATPPAGQFDRALEIALACSDDRTGCMDYVYTIDGTAPSFSPVVGTLVDGEEVTPLFHNLSEDLLIRVAARDGFGNISPVQDHLFEFSGGAYNIVISFDEQIDTSSVTPIPFISPLLIESDTQNFHYVTHLSDPSLAFPSYVAVFDASDSFAAQFEVASYFSLDFDASTNRLYSSDGVAIYAYDLFGNVQQTTNLPVFVGLPDIAHVGTKFFVVNSLENKVLGIDDTSGAILTEFSSTDLNNPFNLFKDSAHSRIFTNNLTADENGNGRIIGFGFGGTIETNFAIPQRTSSGLNVDPTSDLILTITNDWAQSVSYITVFDQKGIIHFDKSNTEVGAPQELSIGDLNLLVADGSMRVTDVAANRLYKYNVSINAPGGPTFAIGGATSGLTGGSLTITNNGVDDTVIVTNGSFAFPTQLLDGSTYNVQVTQHPVGQFCSIQNATGMVNLATVTDIVIQCQDVGLLEVVAITPSQGQLSVAPCTSSAPGLPCEGEILIQFNATMDVSQVPIVDTEILIPAGGGFVNVPCGVKTFNYTTTSVPNDTLSVTLGWVHFPERVQIRWRLDDASVRSDTGSTLAAPEVHEFTTTGRGVSFNIPDTQQAKCYSDLAEISCVGPEIALFPGQDGSLQDTPQAHTFTTSMLSGDAITTDDVTGLVWNSCSDNQSGATCIGVPANRSWVDSVNQCSVLNESNAGMGYAGRTNWRLPTVRELSMLWDFSRSSPAIDPVAFPNTPPAQNYWTSTSQLIGGSITFGIISSEGLFIKFGVAFPSAEATVRCVSETMAPQPIAFANNANLVVDDVVTGLTWQRCPAGRNSNGGCSDNSGEADFLSWPDALTFCDSLNTSAFGGKTSWHLPNHYELLSTLDPAKSNFNNSIMFPGFFSDDRYWTSTTRSNQTANAFVMQIGQGLSSPSTPKDSLRRAKCVAN